MDITAKQVAGRLGKIVHDKEAHDSLLLYIDFQIDRIRTQLERADITQIQILQGQIHALRNMKSIKDWCEAAAKE